ncbi:MAG: hypothetical protein AB9869_36965 [Verrucomicrobiia bacterium]
MKQRLTNPWLLATLSAGAVILASLLPVRAAEPNQTQYNEQYPNLLRSAAWRYLHRALAFHATVRRCTASATAGSPARPGACTGPDAANQLLGPDKWSGSDGHSNAA